MGRCKNYSHFLWGQPGRVGWKLYLFLVAFWGLPCGKLGRRDRGTMKGRVSGGIGCYLVFFFHPSCSLSLGRDSSPSVSPCLPPPLPPSLAPSLLVGKDSSPKKMGTPHLELSLISFPHWIWRGKGMGGRLGDSLVPELGKAQAGLMVSIVKLLY